jgi:hypothetical protein
VADTLFCLAAVLLCVGGVLGLQQAGLPPYATYLLGGSVALGAGWALLRLRAWDWAGRQVPPGKGAAEGKSTGPDPKGTPDTASGEPPP